MSKSTLGRGLGDLLGSDRSTPPVAPPRAPGVGLRILIRGAAPVAEVSSASSEGPRFRPAVPSVPQPSPRESDGALLARLLAIAGLAGADLALLGWSAHFVFTHPQAMSVPGLFGCAASVLLAALCGCAAALLAIQLD